MVEVQFDRGRRMGGSVDTQAGPAVGDQLAPQVPPGRSQQSVPGLALPAGERLELAALLAAGDARIERALCWLWSAW